MPTEAARVERRRKQCRVSQRRYRDKKGSMEYNLRLDVNSLRERVERLRQTRELLHTKIWNDRLSLSGAVRKSVEQYYTMFAHGLHNPEVDEHAKRCHDVQVSFLGAFMDQQVRFGDQCGRDVVYEQWRRYSQFHSRLLVHVNSVEVFGTQLAPTARALGVCNVRLTRATIENVFPHLLRNEELVQALIGKQVQYKTCTNYAFNESVQCVRQDMEVDFVDGLSALLADVFLTTDVVRQALISESSKIGSNCASRVQIEELSEEEEGKTVEELEPEPRGGEEKAVASQSRPPSSRLDLRFIMS